MQKARNVVETHPIFAVAVHKPKVSSNNVPAAPKLLRDNNVQVVPREVNNLTVSNPMASNPSVFKAIRKGSLNVSRAMLKDNRVKTVFRAEMLLRPPNQLLFRQQLAFSSR